MIVSVGDHVVEPAHVWRHWLPSRFRDAGPRVERRRLGGLVHIGGTRYEYEIDPADGSGEWCDLWVYDDRVRPHKRHQAAVGHERDESTVQPITYEEMRPGCFDPTARIDDLFHDGIDRSLTFPTFPRSCGQTFLEGSDQELALACVRAYNDWLIEDWCSDSRGVLVPVGIVPLWDPDLAAAEVRRNAERGCRAVAFPDRPARLDLPTIHTGWWGPLIVACAETDSIVCVAIGSTAQPPTARDATADVAETTSVNDAMASLSDWLFSGALATHPDLRLTLTGGQIGWLPHLLERADVVWERHRSWTGTRHRVPEPPSSFWYRQCFGCFSTDQHGLDNIDRIGSANVAFESGYPGIDSSWPHTLETVEKMVIDLDDDTAYRILRGNGLRMLGLD